jgi:hypothetical protein
VRLGIAFAILVMVTAIALLSTALLLGALYVAVANEAGTAMGLLACGLAALMATIGGALTVNKVLK